MVPARSAWHSALLSLRERSHQSLIEFLLKGTGGPKYTGGGGGENSVFHGIAALARQEGAPGSCRWVHGLQDPAAKGSDPGGVLQVEPA